MLRCENVGVPTYSDAPLPEGLDALVGMGMNRVKLAITVTSPRIAGASPLRTCYWH
jgi:hypothetical protein